MPKKSKSEIGYIYEPGSELVCGDCIMLKPIGTAKYERGRDFLAGCAWIGPDDPVKPKTGSCREFHRGDPTQFKIPWLGIATKQSLDYSESPKGFGCRRCKFMAIADLDCSEVDKDSSGPTPGEISPMSCCDLQKPDAKRSKMTTPELLLMIEGLRKSDPKKAQDFDEYVGRRKGQ